MGLILLIGYVPIFGILAFLSMKLAKGMLTTFDVESLGKERVKKAKLIGITIICILTLCAVSLIGGGSKVNWTQFFYQICLTLFMPFVFGCLVMGIAKYRSAKAQDKVSVAALSYVGVGVLHGLWAAPLFVFVWFGVIELFKI